MKSPSIKSVARIMMLRVKVGMANLWKRVKAKMEVHKPLMGWRLRYSPVFACEYGP